MMFEMCLKATTPLEGAGIQLLGFAPQTHLELQGVSCPEILDSSVGFQVGDPELKVLASAQTGRNGTRGGFSTRVPDKRHGP